MTDHGTNARYKAGCRCERCTAAHTIYARSKAAANGYRPKRRRGNPNWGKSIKLYPDAAPPGTPPLTEFEKLALTHNIAEENWHRSLILREFAAKHRNRLYVPENLLDLWGLQPDEEGIT